jgi:hypothetical protein
MKKFSPHPQNFDLWDTQYMYLALDTTPSQQNFKISIELNNRYNVHFNKPVHRASCPKVPRSNLGRETNFPDRGF